MTNNYKKEFDKIRGEMKNVYLHDTRPWMIGFSGGKDSTLLCQLAFEVVMELKPEERKKKIYIVSSDTMVENPIIRDYMFSMSDLIGEFGAKYNIFSKIIQPDSDKTFWSYLIGKGYPTPEAPGFRWCTDRLKIKPINKFTVDTIKNNGEVVMLLGVRKAESSYRARGISKREIEGKLLIRHTDIENAYVYNPLTEIPNEEVWGFLLSNNGKSAWGSDNKYLFSLYQGENLGEEQSSLGEVDNDKIKITGNSRFGCWVCTMVHEDKSLLNFINKGSEELIPLRDFRNWLLEIRNDPKYRDNKRRNGAVYIKANGDRGQGPFNMHGRQTILRKLLELEVVTGWSLITKDELKEIDKIWEQEGDLYKRTLVELYSDVKGEKLPWDEYRKPLFSEQTLELIDSECREHNLAPEYIHKLIIAVEENKHYTRGKKVEKAINKVLSEGWIHYDQITKEKGKITNEN